MLVPAKMPGLQWGADFSVTIDGHRKMNTRKWISQIGHRINIRPKCAGVGSRVEVDAFEWNNSIMPGETKIPRDFIRIKAGGIYHISCFNLPPG